MTAKNNELWHRLVILEEVGQEFGVTRERIRQLQNIALKKLRRALQKKEDPAPRPLGQPGPSDDDFFSEH